MAIKNERWDLAAHVVVLETALQLEKEGMNNGRKSQEKKGSTEG
jgi:hypothetical protein